MRYLNLGFVVAVLSAMLVDGLRSGVAAQPMLTPMVVAQTVDEWKTEGDH